VLVALVLPFAPRIGFIGLALLLPLITRFIPRAGPGINASTALFPLAVLSGLLYSRPPLPRLKVLAPFFAYFALTLIGYAILVTTTDSRDETLARTSFEIMKSRLWPTLLFFAGFALAPDPVIRRRVLMCMVAGLILHSMSGVYDFVTRGAGTPDAAIGAAASDYRAAGILDSNPNILGGHLAAFSVLALMGFMRRENPMWLRVFCVGAYAVSGMVLILTQSRGSWLGFLVAHAVWLFYTHRKLFLPAIAATAVLAVAAYSASLLPESMTKRIEETLTPGHVLYARESFAGHFDSSVNARLAVHATAAAIFADSPIWGHGFGSFRRLALEYGATHGLWGLGGVSSESIILNTAVEGGLIGLLIYGWLFWVILSPGPELIRRRKERDLGIALVAIFCAIFVESLTQIAFFLPEISLGLWLVAGMAARAGEDDRRVPAAG
jgi:O-antigen ligase